MQRQPVQSTGTAATGLHFCQPPPQATKARHRRLSLRAAKAQGGTGRQVVQTEYRLLAATLSFINHQHGTSPVLQIRIQTSHRRSPCQLDTESSALSTHISWQ